MAPWTMQKCIDKANTWIMHLSIDMTGSWLHETMKPFIDYQVVESSNYAAIESNLCWCLVWWCWLEVIESCLYWCLVWWCWLEVIESSLYWCLVWDRGDRRLLSQVYIDAWPGFAVVAGCCCVKSMLMLCLVMNARGCWVKSMLMHGLGSRWPDVVVPNLC